MLTRPGQTARAYCDGQRIRYTNPLKYAFFGATFMIAVVSFFELRLVPLEWGDPTPEQEHVMRVVLALTAYLTFLGSFLLAGLMRLVFAQRARNILELFVLIILMAGTEAWVFSLLSPLGWFTIPQSFFVHQGISMAYFIWAIRGFYGRGNWWTWGGAVVVGLLSLVVEMSLGLLISFSGILQLF